MFEQFKKIDIYGRKLTMTINNNSKIETGFGAFFTFITFILFILAVVFFGSDLYHKKNPKVTSVKNAYSIDEITTFSPNSTENPNKVVIFKFDRGFELWNYLLVQENIPGYNWTKSNYYKLPFCKDEYIKKTLFAGNDEKFSSKIKDYIYFCLNTSQYYFGSMDYFDSYYSNSLWLWTVGCNSTAYKKYGIETLVCQDLDQSYMSSTVSVIYENIYFHYDDYENPFSTFWVQQEFRVQRNQDNVVYLSLGRHNLTDDDGWLISNSKTTMEMGGEDFHINFIYLPKTKNYFDVTFQVGYDQSYMTYTRRYMRIQELLANIGGILKAIMVLCQILVSFYTQYTLDFIMLNKTFQCLTKEQGINHDKFNSSNFPLNLKSEYENSNINNIHKKLDQGTKVNNLINTKNNLDFKKIQVNRVDVSEVLTFKNYLLFTICGIFKKNEQDSTGTKFLMEKLIPSAHDVRSIENLIKYFREISILKMILFNKEQIIGLDYIKNPEIVLDDQYSDDITENYYSFKIKNDEEKIRNLKAYYQIISSDMNNSTPNDRLILRNLNEEILNKIKQ